MNVPQPTAIGCPSGKLNHCVGVGKQQSLVLQAPARRTRIGHDVAHAQLTALVEKGVIYEAHAVGRRHTRGDQRVSGEFAHELTVRVKGIYITLPVYAASEGDHGTCGLRAGR